jgi:hypothetical protein
MIRRSDQWTNETVAYSTKGLRALLDAARKNPHFDASRLTRLQWRWIDAPPISAHAFTLGDGYRVELGETTPLVIRGILDDLLDAAAIPRVEPIDPADLFALAPLADAGQGSGVPHEDALPARRNMARALAGRGAMFVMAHELAHVLRGHLELANTHHINGIAEDYDAQASNMTYPRRYVEYDADAFGIGLLLDLYETTPSFVDDTDNDVAQEAYWIHLSALIVLMLMDRRFPDGFQAGQQYPCFKRRALAVSRSLSNTIDARYGVGLSQTGEVLQHSWATLARIAERLAPEPQRLVAVGTPVTRRPPLRSVRAALPHTAPA